MTSRFRLVCREDVDVQLIDEVGDLPCRPRIVGVAESEHVHGHPQRPAAAMNGDSAGASVGRNTARCIRKRD